MRKKFEIRESIILENEGEKIFGIIHRPLSQSKKGPAVLFCHGLGGHKCGRYRVYVSLAEQLSKEGITVLRIDFRGSGDSEGEFSEMTLQGELSDARKAIEFLLHDSLVDNSRIGFFGRSLGGSIAVITAANFEHTKSLALWAPIFDGKQWEKHWKIAKDKLVSEQELQEMRRINGQVASLKFFEEMFNMNLHLELQKLLHVPLLHIHGEKDVMVSVQHAEGYEKERQKAQAISKFIRVPTDHEFAHAIERQYALEETVKWFKETL